MKPTIGRIVHFYLDRSDEHDDPISSIITKVHNDTCVNLRLFYDDDEHAHTEHVTSVTPRYKGEGWGWEWPPRV